jgi:NAD(P)H-binding
VIVRPVILTDGPKTATYRALVDPRGWTCGYISRADVADFLVKQIDDDAFLQTLTLRYEFGQVHRDGSAMAGFGGDRRKCGALREKRLTVPSPRRAG